MASSAFNKEELNFRLIPKDAEIEQEVVEEYLAQLPNPKKQKSNLIKHLSDGIRMDPVEQGYRCVMCDEKWSTFDEATDHVIKMHKEPVNVLRNTPCKPVVGLDLIIEFRNDKDEIVEYECTLCGLHLSKPSIFWHVISSLHKEKFFQQKFSSEFVDQIDDPKLKQEKIDQVLINHENSQHDRGRFLYRRFDNGMIESSSVLQTKLNMAYIKKLYPTETSRLNYQISQREQWLLPLQNNLKITIENEEQFKRGKELLQKMNKALIEYSNKN